MEDKVYQVFDKETQTNIDIKNPSFYGPAIPQQDTAYRETGCSLNINGKEIKVEFEYQDKPTEDYQKQMWETIDNFETVAWSPKSKGVKTNFPSIDKAFDGGITPQAFVIIAGVSNIGKTALLSQMAWQIATAKDDNGDYLNDAYVMDFSLDDSMADKLSRVAAASGKIVINSVKTPLNYTQYPLMLIRRKQALINIRNNADRYRAYDATFSTFIEDIEEEIQRTLIYFKTNNIDK